MQVKNLKKKLFKTNIGNVLVYDFKPIYKNLEKLKMSELKFLKRHYEKASNALYRQTIKEFKILIKKTKNPIVIQGLKTAISNTEEHQYVFFRLKFSEILEIEMDNRKEVKLCK